MVISGWDLLILEDGTGSVVVHCDGPPPRTLPVGPLPAQEARRLAEWLCRGGATHAEEVRAHVHAGTRQRATGSSRKTSAVVRRSPVASRPLE